MVLELVEVGDIESPADLDLAQALQELLQEVGQFVELLQGILLVGVVLDQLLLAVAGPWELLCDQMEK